MVKIGSDRSVKAGGNISGSQIITGDGNMAQMRDVKVQLTSGADVNLGEELAALREILITLNAPDAGKIDRALQDAEEEAGKEEPDKEEIGSALERAVKHAKNASDFGEHVGKLAARLGPIVSWLGDKWKTILTIAGIGA